MKRLGFCFFLSGFAALLYETAWMRQLAVAFGTSELATITVLAAFMGGLGAGSWLGERLPGSPVRTYALLEWGAGASALLVTPLLARAGAVAVWGLGGQPFPPAAGGLLQPTLFFATGLALLALPTAALGATLPVLSRTLEAPILYALNVGGAVLGTLAAAFLFIPAWGLTATVGVGAAINLAAGLLAWTLGRGSVAAPGPRVPAPRLVLVLAAGTGALGLAYEVLWTRILSLVVGSGVSAFALLLAACLTGLALGSGASVRWRGSAWAGLVASQLAAAAVFTLDWGWAVHRPSVALVAALVPAFALQGASFTFLLRLLAVDSTPGAQAAGRAYRWNTWGAILGTVLVGFVLVPVSGFAGTTLLLAGGSLLLALSAALASRSRSLVTAGAAGVCVTALAVVVVVRGGDSSELLRTVPGGGRVTGEIIFAATGPSASVLLTRDGGSLSLFVNGLGQSSTRLRGAPRVPSSQEWLGILPSVYRPGARSALVIGLGLGEALEGLPASLREVDVVELEPQVLAACRVAEPWRRTPARAARIVINDARGALRLTSRRYDLVIAQASYPWTAGASHLYTREFLEEVHGHLTPGGVYAQWIGLQAVDDLRFRSLTASLLATFAHVELYEPVPGLPVFLASDWPFEVPRATCLEDILAARRVDESALRKLAAGRAPGTDDRNLFVAPVGLGPPLGPQGLRPLAASALPAGLDLPYYAHRLVHLGFPDEALKLGEEPMVRARALWAQGDHQGALKALGSLQDEPARFLRSKPQLWPYQAGSARAAGFTGAYAVVVEAAQRAAAGDWEAVARLEDGLAAVPHPHLAYETAAQLRAGWRLSRGRPGALAVLDDALQVAWDPYTLVLRAQSARAAGDDAALWESLRDLVGLLWWSHRRPVASGRLEAMVREVLPETDRDGVVGHLNSLLREHRVY